MPTPATQLLGRTLDNGWTITERIDRRYGSTGGNFSESYVVESPSAQIAFLKALDVSRAAQMPGSIADNLKVLIDAFVAERDMLHKCHEKGLTKIVKSLDSGEIHVNSSPLGRVPYIIFERAEHDIRAELDMSQSFDTALSLRFLHNLSVALDQLHRVHIAHQDVKPSNVLIFQDKTAKLADLGRASYKGTQLLHDELPVAGDRAYAPPELLYGYVSHNWNERRNACDMYLFGSMIFFVFAGTPLTPWLGTKLHPDFSWDSWTDDYSSVLPYVRDAFDTILDEFKSYLPDDHRDFLLPAVTQLCDPDPSRRGHPKSHAATGDSYSMERYISALNLIARRAELRVKRQIY